MISMQSERRVPSSMAFISSLWVMISCAFLSSSSKTRSIILASVSSSSPVSAPSETMDFISFSYLSSPPSLERRNLRSPIDQLSVEDVSEK